MRKVLVAGNWKMNGTQASIAALLDEIVAGLDVDASRVDVAVCPPFVFIPEVAERLQSSRIAWGGQDVCEQPAGAFTGQVAAPMLREFGCRYVIVGHSERRQLNAETDDLVAKKYQAAQQAGLVPIVCIGETLAEREAGQTEEVVSRQLMAVLDAAGTESLRQAVIAYEPVWAIGTGHTATPEQAQAVHQFLRQAINARSAPVAEAVQILYGGSMKAANAAELLAQADIDGGLIGGASLKAAEFLAICAAGGTGSFR